MARQYAKDQPAGFRNKLENVAIVGVAGQIGKEITKAILAESKLTLTAITREGSTSQVPPGVQAKKVDYDNHDSLVSALRGQDALIITMSVNAPQESSQKLIKAAVDAGVSWVMPNEYGADYTGQTQLAADVMIGTGILATRSFIESVGLSWVSIACGFWYDYSLASHKVLYGFDIPEREVTFYDDGKTLLNTSSRPFCGLAAARVLGLKLLPDDENDNSPSLADFRNRNARVAGFLVNQRDMLASIQRVTGTTDKDWKVTARPVQELFKEGTEMLKSGNRLGFGQMLYTRFFYPDDSGNFEKRQGLDNEALGMKREDLDEWTKEAVDLSYQPSLFRPEGYKPAHLEGK